MKKVSRNDPCPCGSGKKYKQCCLKQDEATAADSRANIVSVPALLQEAIGYHQAGHLEQAQALYSQILLIDPNHADALHLRGLISHQSGDNDTAIALIGRAIKLNPAAFPYHTNLGSVLVAQGRLSEAIESYSQALILKPDHAEAHYNLGTVFQAQNFPDKAINAYQKAISFKPDYAEAHNNLAATLKSQNRLDEAIESYTKALSFNPDYADAHNNLGVALQAQGKLERAVTCCRKAISLKPDFAEAHNNLGAALKEQGHLDEAAEHYRKAAVLKPLFTEAHNNLGVVLQEQGQLDEAVECYNQLLLHQPDFPAAHYNLGNVLHLRGRIVDATECYHRAIALKPDYAEAHNNLGNVLKDQGQMDQAAGSYRRALEIKPDYDMAYSNLLFLQAYHALSSPDEYLAHARNWEVACIPEQDRIAARSRTFQHPPLSGRRLKVGYVSGDFRQHPVSFNMEQIFRNHDRSRFEVFAYSTTGIRDAVTERIQATVEHWVPVMGMSDSALRDRIAADSIDVLIDLSGHTAHNRLGVFARRAAPVQAYYLGYFASTGLTEMDFLFGDDVLTPPETDSHFSEKVWRLPRIWQTYTGRDNAPATNWQPDPGGTIWLGSFNNLGKLTPATFALWAKVLLALPEARLLLKTRELADAGNRQSVFDVMAGHGVTQDRIELQDWSVTQDWAAHMAYYDRLDIALDPVGGMGGGITTCDALWMGVPVVTLAGDRYASRVSADIISSVGYPEWLASSGDEYVNKVVSLARNVPLRKTLRPAQRARVAASPLCDAPGLTRLLEDAYTQMFVVRTESR